MPPVADEPRTLIDDLLAEQQRMTAVERFSRLHERDALPAQEKYYRALLPASPPGEGEQYAFAVDLDACTGCKGCVTACHNLNGLDDGEVWRNVGLLHGGTSEEPFQQTVTTACHHCVDPACMNGCPVNAYDKDEITGIVRHLDDQCIGCQYCILKCPYDVPKYSSKRGIVRKCDMCASRLAVNEAPACVQACPNEAIRITTVRKADIIADAARGHFLPGSPDPAYTQPTTRYLTKRQFPVNAAPADLHEVQPGHAHPPLVVMLVLTQLSVGAFCVAMLLRLVFPEALMHSMAPWQSLVALVLGLLALGASTLHLGRPLYAWRAFVGLKTSWLSREIIVFALFAQLALIYAGSFWLPSLSRLIPAYLLRSLASAVFQDGLGTAVCLSGIAGVYCSMMIYQDTRRTFWRPSITTLKFAGTMLVLGPATILLTMSAQAAVMPAIAAEPAFRQIERVLCILLACITVAKLVWEFSALFRTGNKHWTNMKRTALLMLGPLKGITIARFMCGALGGIALPLVARCGFTTIGIAAGIVLLSLGGELLERHLFFAAVVPPKMPGGVAS